MGKIQLPPPVKLFIGILSGESFFFSIVEDRLSSIFGPIDLKTNSEGISFNFSDYYAKEMGSNLKRMFLSFKKLISPGDISSIKIKTNDLEELIATEAKNKILRPINLDPGYLSASKIVLATTKDYAHRIYLRNGIYSEITLQYRTSTLNDTKGFQAMAWTYPDYKTQPYLDFFHKMRVIYLDQKHEK
jgi:hypothetical protein